MFLSSFASSSSSHDGGLTNAGIAAASIATPPKCRRVSEGIRFNQKKINNQQQQQYNEKRERREDHQTYISSSSSPSSSSSSSLFSLLDDVVKEDRLRSFLLNLTSRLETFERSTHLKRNQTQVSKDEDDDDDHQHDEYDPNDSYHHPHHDPHHPLKQSECNLSRFEQDLHSFERSLQIHEKECCERQVELEQKMESINKNCSYNYPPNNNNIGVTPKETPSIIVESRATMSPELDATRSTSRVTHQTSVDVTSDVAPDIAISKDDRSRNETA